MHKYTSSRVDDQYCIGFLGSTKLYSDRVCLITFTIKKMISVSAGKIWHHMSRKFSCQYRSLKQDQI